MAGYEGMDNRAVEQWAEGLNLDWSHFVRRMHERGFVSSGKPNTTEE